MNSVIESVITPWKRLTLKLAWDNFDISVAIMTGTLHDTVGTTYQARFKDDMDVTNETTTENIVTE